MSPHYAALDDHRLVAGGASHGRPGWTRAGGRDASRPAVEDPPGTTTPRPGARIGHTLPMACQDWADYQPGPGFSRPPAPSWCCTIPPSSSSPATLLTPSASCRTSRKARHPHSLRVAPALQPGGDDRRAAPRPGRGQVLEPLRIPGHQRRQTDGQPDHHPDRQDGERSLVRERDAVHARTR